MLMKWGSLNKAILATLLILSCAIISSPMPAGEPDRDEKAELWKKVVELHRKGYDARAKEQVSPGDKRLKEERKAIYREAVSSLKNYMRYLPDEKSITYLRAIYRLALYFELAGEPESALVYYKKCENHPNLNDLQALWDKKPLAPQLKKRLEAIYPKIPRNVVKGASYRQ